MIECPKIGGSAYFNYKNFHSIVLLAVCDAKYCFTIADIGGYGCSNDASILSNSTFGEIFENHPFTLKIPCPARFDDKKLPYVLLGDEFFPLRPWLMKPYPGKQLDETQRIFNYRLSRARRTIENAFGILSSKWIIFRKPIRANVDLAEKIVKATVCLHNYLRLTENANYIPSGFVDCEDGNGNIIPGNWRSEVDYKDGGMTPVSRIGGNRYTYKAGRSRDDFKDYFNSPLGEVPWQLDYVRHLGRTQHKR
ncbi:PREDICTED: putative nuclease HARBI1 [Acropora digitifera]|uniref:putative nuclease HARBI1 n=1 Tax=Acropora digitifera TaxID=70779 RepID=UPI00077A4D78|nr:PREDICTED: putative nuclease HARBI1 [Acropora digitifera]